MLVPLTCNITLNVIMLGIQDAVSCIRFIQITAYATKQYIRI